MLPCNALAPFVFVHSVPVAFDSWVGWNLYYPVVSDAIVGVVVSWLHEYRIRTWRRLPIRSGMQLHCDPLSIIRPVRRNQMTRIAPPSNAHEAVV